MENFIFEVEDFTAVDKMGRNALHMAAQANKLENLEDLIKYAQEEIFTDKPDEFKKFIDTRTNSG